MPLYKSLGTFNLIMISTWKQNQLNAGLFLIVFYLKKILTKLIFCKFFIIFLHSYYYIQKLSDQYNNVQNFERGAVRNSDFN